MKQQFQLPQILQKEQAGMVTRRKFILLISYSAEMEIVCQTEMAFEIGYLEKDVLENISKKAKKLSVKMSKYIASIKKSNISTKFTTIFKQYFRSCKNF